MRKRNLAAACVLVPTIALLVLAAPAPIASAADTSGPTIIPMVHNDVSVPLTAMVNDDSDKKDKKDKKEKPHRKVPVMRIRAPRRRPSPALARRSLPRRLHSSLHSRASEMGSPDRPGRSR